MARFHLPILKHTICNSLYQFHNLCCFHLQSCLHKSGHFPDDFCSKDCWLPNGRYSTRPGQKGKLSSHWVRRLMLNYRSKTPVRVLATFCFLTGHYYWILVFRLSFLMVSFTGLRESLHSCWKLLFQPQSVQPLTNLSLKLNISLLFSHLSFEVHLFSKKK